MIYYSVGYNPLLSLIILILKFTLILTVESLWNWLLCLLDMCASFSSTSSTSYLWLILYFYCPSSRSASSLRSLNSFTWRVIFRSQDLVLSVPFTTSAAHLGLDYYSRNRAVSTDFAINKSTECFSTGLDVHASYLTKEEEKTNNWFFSGFHQEVIVFILCWDEHQKKKCVSIVRDGCYLIMSSHFPSLEQ